MSKPHGKNGPVINASSKSGCGVFPLALETTFSFLSRFTVPGPWKTRGRAQPVVTLSLALLDPNRLPTRSRSPGRRSSTEWACVCLPNLTSHCVEMK
jgi:hypothetical protein